MKHLPALLWFLCDEEAVEHPPIERERKHRWHSCGGNNRVPIRELGGANEEGKSCTGFEFANARLRLLSQSLARVRRD